LKLFLADWGYVTQQQLKKSQFASISQEELIRFIEDHE